MVFAYLIAFPVPVLLPLAVLVYGQDVLLLSAICIAVMLFAFGLIVIGGKLESGGSAAHQPKTDPRD